MRDPVDAQLESYLVICCGVGMLFGSVGGWLFRNFLLPNMYIAAVALIAVGIGQFWYSVHKSKGERA